MAGKPQRMSQIKQLIQLHKQGKGKKTIARQLGMSKNTVKAYLTRFESGQLNTDDLLAIEEPILEAKLFAGHPAYKQERYEHFKGKLSYFAAELKKVGVTRQLLWEEYRGTQPDGYGYTQFKHHLQNFEKRTDYSMPIQHKYGDKLFIDFTGKKLSVVDRTSGEVKEMDLSIDPAWTSLQTEVNALTVQSNQSSN